MSNDFINRQSAIDSIKALWDNAQSAQHLSAMFDCEDAIRALPSAQPEIIHCEDCRQAVIDLWEKYHPTIAVDAMQYDAKLRQLLSAQPEQKEDDALWRQ